MKSSVDRRDFICNSGVAALGMAILPAIPRLAWGSAASAGKRIGIIGLDTSHSTEFTKSFNDPAAPPSLGGYKVVAAYPWGTRDIPSATGRIPEYTEEVKKAGVEIVDSIALLLKKVDVVMLETNDGRLHLEQALEVFRSGKKVFIDKPIAATLSDAISIFDAAEKYHVPLFSCSSLRFMSSLRPILAGDIGRVLGADTYSPAGLEKTHADLFWYGIHGVETLYTVMGTGCEQVVRIHTEDTDVVVGTWKDGRVGSFRGTRSGQHSYGGTVYGEKTNQVIGPVEDYLSLLIETAKFFDTGKAPVAKDETLEICCFMEAADESKRRKGSPVSMKEVWDHAMKIKRIV
jgi:predicted dehydrogenase